MICFVHKIIVNILLRSPCNQIVACIVSRRFLSSGSRRPVKTFALLIWIGIQGVKTLAFVTIVLQNPVALQNTMYKFGLAWVAACLQ